jgi:ribonuclease VapC
MILDASAILSILLEKPGHDRIVNRLNRASITAVGAPTLVEAAMVLTTRLERDARPLLNQFLREAEVEVIPFTREHFEIAMDAFRRYGKGRHPAALNFGDCLCYAVARISGFPLLYTGDDFSKTDLQSA